jgi:DNA-binding PadR family transcriptional regulator
LSTASGLPTGTIHPILARLEKLGWLESHWEDIDPVREGRPRRRYYRLSPDGAEYARTALHEARMPVSRILDWGPKPGMTTGGPA